MFLVLLIVLGILLRLRLDVCVALVALWLLALWIETGDPSLLPVLQVLGVVALVVVMYWGTFVRKEKL